MSLLHPEFLLALAVLAIPIIIHLFNFRRFKKVIFPNVRFLKKIDLETRSKNKLKHLLILLTRLLALSALVLAFARPYLPSNDNEKRASEQHVAIYVDNSYSMNLENDKGNLLSQGIEMAEDIVDAFGRNDRFLLLTNDLKPEHQLLLSKAEVLDHIGGITESPASRSYSEIIERASDALERKQGVSRKLYYISDFQESGFDPGKLKNDTSLTYNLVKLEHLGQGNVYIDSIWFESPIRSIHSPEKLAVRVINASAKDLFDIPIRLTINGQQKAIGNMSLKPFSSADSILTFSNPSSGWLSGEVSLDDNPITFDDALDFSYQVREQSKVMVLGNASDRQLVERIFATDPFFKTSSSTLGQLDISTLKDQDLIILSEISSLGSGLISELDKFAESGGSICLIPSLGADRNSLNEFLLSVEANTIIQKISKESEVSGLEANHALFEDVFDQIPRNMDLPTVRAYFSFNARVRSSEERIMSLRDGSSLLSAFNSGKGRTYVFSCGIDRKASNLTSHSLFVTALLRMAELSLGSDQLYHEIGNDKPVSLRLGQKQKESIYKFSNESSDELFIPEQNTIGSVTRFFERGQVQDAGIYSIQSEQQEFGRVAYNLDRDESKMSFLSSEELTSQMSRNGMSNYKIMQGDTLNESGSLNSNIAGKQLWRHFLILGLLFLILEVVLLKFWKL